METTKTGKDAYYFSHDNTALNDPKIMLMVDAIGIEGYGVYWVLIELLHQESNHKLPLSISKSIARRINSTDTKVTQVIREYDLFKIDGNLFWSESLIRRIETRQDLSNQMRDLVNRRWGNKNTSRNTDGNTVGNTLKERKGKEIKGKDINIKENIKEKNTDNNKLILPDWIPLEEWNGFLEMRSSMKVLNTPLSIKKLVNELSNLKTQGYDPVKVLDQSIINGWRGVFAIKNNGNGNGELKNGVNKNNYPKQSGDLTQRLKDSLNT